MVNDVRTELHYDGVWNDVSTDVRQEPPITMSWGRKNEAAKVSPSSLSLTLENADGTYSPRNPLSALYGKLTRNTPIRVRLGDTNAALTLPGRDGSYASTPDSAALDITGDIDVRVEITPDSWRPDFGEGSLMHLASKWDFADGASERSWAFSLLEDGTLEFTWSPDGTFGSKITPVSTVTIPVGSGRLAVRVALDADNGASGNDTTFYTAPDIAGPWTQLGATVTNAGTASIYSGSAELAVGATTTGISFSPGECFRGDVHAFELRGGIGAATLVAAPDFTTADAGDTTLTDAQGNVWTLNGFASITDQSVRFAGEVASWPPEWDHSGKDVRVPVEAAGIRRRMGQGEKPINSSLYRDLSNKDNVPLYWPLESGSGATIFPAATGGGPLRASGDVSPGAYTDLDASDAIPTFKVGNVRGNIDTYSPELDQRLQAVVSVPDNGVANNAQLFEVRTSGSASQWILSIDEVGNLDLVVNDDEGNTVVNTGPIAFNMNGFTGLAFISFTQNGSDIDWKIGTFEPGASTAGTFSGTLTGHDYNRLTWLRFGTYNVDLNGLAGGHISLLNGDIDAGFWDTAGTSLRAWSGETAGDRIVRLCGEEGIPLRVLGDMATTAAMGAQRIDTLLNLLDECAEVDMGVLSDDRDAVRLLYRARSDLYTQDVALSLNYSAGEVAPRLRPVEDDQLIRNDVTVKRPSGGSHQEVLATGPMSTAEVGLYDTAPEVNLASDDQLRDQAAWRLHLGTVDEPRYPTITGDLTATPSKVTAATSVFAGDRIQVTSPPSWQPPDTIDQLAQGGTEKLTPYRHVISYNCSPASPWNAVVVDTTKVDTAGSELNTGITDSATSMDVATTVGEDWTTDASEVPFDVELGGEVVTVTAVGAAVGSVQTFTVTRATNGITKAHDAGTAVRLAAKHRGHVAMRETAA